MEFEGNASNWPFFDTLHQVGGKAGDLVSEFFGWDGPDAAQDFLVVVEIVSEFLVVFLNEDLGGLLDSLGSYSTLKAPNQK